MSLAWWLNSAWMWKCRREAGRFAAATRAVRRTQESLLQEIIHRNQETWFGRKLGFQEIRQAREFQRQVPLSRYDDCVEAVNRIAAGERHVLTHEPVELLEPTSGTTRGEKLIPYTASLRREFQRAVAAWIANLFQNRPAVRAGRAYWSISPALGRSAVTAGGIRTGFDDDAAYLGVFEQRALRHLLVAPPTLARIADIEAFRYATLWALLTAEDLAMVSVWNPTFLSSLIRSMESWTERLIDDLRHGTPRFSPAIPAATAQSIAVWCKYRPERRKLVAEVLEQSDDLSAKLQKIWPRLALISCWTDAAAALVVPEIRTLFPAVEIQPKGLLATEGCVSFPLVGRPGSILAVRSHFFEFAPAGAGNQTNITAGDTLLAHELESGHRYRVVITTSGGLYRYQLNDEVEVVDFENECPLIRFVGKSDRVCDLVGEKLGETHVRSVLQNAFTKAEIAPNFAMLVPDVAERPFRYRLYVELTGAERVRARAEWLAPALESGLGENPHYRYAVGLGQLGPVEVRLLESPPGTAWPVYENRCLARGQKLGNIKPAVLDAWTGWPEIFTQPPFSRSGADRQPD
jgi:hypothetical protein